MTDWYRNTEWDADVEAAFETKLARSRGQKAQYLRIQGSMLKDTHPEVAVRLLGRCIELGDVFFVAHAFLDQAHAYYRMGDVEQALASLEAAIEQEKRHPMSRTSAPFDFAMLVALHNSVERYEAALRVLEDAEALFPVMDFQREAARAMIYAARGQRQHAQRAAIRALEAEQIESGWIPGHPNVGVVPKGDNPISAQLRRIAAT